MKNVLITGITGLLGSTLARVIKSRDVHIVGVSRSMRDDRRMQYVLSDIPNYTMCYGSVGNYDFINNVINSYEIDTVFHFGAQAIVANAELAPRNTFTSNIEGTVNILESARKNKVKAVATISSDKMYGHAPVPYVESASVEPKEVYSTSKTCSDFITQCYGKNFAVPCVVFRSCNFFGPGDFNFTRIVPNSIIRALKNEEGEHPFLWSGVADYIREFIYSEDAANLILRVVDKLRVNETMYGEPYNIGSGVTYRVGDFIEKIVKQANPKSSVDIRKKDFEFKEIEKQWVSLEKLKSVIGPINTRTETDIEGCLDDTIKFYKDYFNL